MNADAGRVRLVQVQRRLGLFAQGLAGRHLELVPCEAGPAGDRGQGAGIDGDGRRIFLPAAIDDFDDARHNLGAYRVAVLHQIGYLEFGSLAFSLGEACRRIPGLPPVRPQPPSPPSSSSSPSSPSSPSQPASDLERFFRLWPAPGLARLLFTMLEDLRIDRVIRLRYPGARADLDRVTALALRRRPALPALPALPAPPAPALLAVLLEALLRFTLGETRARLLDAIADGLLADPTEAAPVEPLGAEPAGPPTAPPAVDRNALLQGLLDAAERVAQEHADVHDSAAATAACLRLLARAGLVRADPRRLPLAPADAPQADPAAAGSGEPPADADADADAQADAADEPPGLMPVPFRGEVRLEVLQAKLGAQGIAAPLDGSLAPLPEPQAGDAEEDAKAAEPAPRATPAAARPAAEAREGQVRSYLYDEWDYHRQAYLEGWCRVLEERLEGDDHDFIRRVHERHGALAQRVRRQFRSIRPESHRRVRRMPEGEELELDEAIRSVLDRRAGHADDARVYMRRDRGQREVSAAFLLDMSASTDIEVPDPKAAAPAPPPAPAEPEDDDMPFLWSMPRDDASGRAVRRVIDVGRESLALMCEAMQALGDRYAIYGFSGYGREQVEFCVAKDFDDRLSPRTWAAIAAMQPRRSTRMGPAIRHALTRLAAEPSRIRVLIVVSDGFPQDRDYGPDRNDDEYGLQDTARALLEAARAGVQTFCVTIDPSGHDYLRRMCPQDRYMVIDEVEDLPDALTKVYRALTF